MDDVVERWLPLIRSPLGLRFARAKADYGVAMPRFETEAGPVCDFEQWLIEEALMAGFFERRAQAEEAAQVRRDAREEGQELLERTLRERG